MRGQPPYHPRLMVKLLVYGYCQGVRSSASWRNGSTIAVARQCAVTSGMISLLYGRQLLSRRLFVTTETLDSAMAAEATTGDRLHPVQGSKTPAASGMPKVL